MLSSKIVKYHRGIQTIICTISWCFPKLKSITGTTRSLTSKKTTLSWRKLNDIAFPISKFQTTCSPQIQAKDTFNHPKHTHTHLYQSTSINTICLKGSTCGHQWISIRHSEQLIQVCTRIHIHTQATANFNQTFQPRSSSSYISQQEQTFQASQQVVKQK